MRLSLTTGAPGELFRAIEQLMEDFLGYEVERDEQEPYPTMKSTGISDVAEFRGTLRGQYFFAKTRIVFIVAGVFLIIFGGFLFYYALSSLTGSQQVYYVAGFAVLLAIGVILIVRSRVRAFISLSVTLEGEAYRGRIAVKDSERYSVLTRCTLSVYTDYVEEPPKSVLEKAEADREKLTEEIKKILPKFQLEKVELPDSNP